MNLGQCHYCHAPIPATQIDGQPAREGIEYKQVMGEPETMWHHSDPRMPDCYRLESDDINSEWYDDPRRYAEDLEDEEDWARLRPAFYEQLENEND